MRCIIYSWVQIALLGTVSYCFCWQDFTSKVDIARHIKETAALSVYVEYVIIMKIL